MADSDSVTWLWTLNGWPWYVVGLLAVIVVYAVCRWSAAETKGLHWSRWIVGLRAAAALVLVSLLLQPACSRIQTISSPPSLAVLVDGSASMAVIDSEMAAEHRLDEAIALGFIEEDLRDRSARDVADALEAIRDAIPAIVQVSQPDSVNDAEAAQLSLDIILPFAQRLAGQNIELEDDDALAKELAIIGGIFTKLQDSFRSVIDADEDTQRILPPKSADVDHDLRMAVAQAIPLARALQTQRDEALVAEAEAAEGPQPIVEGLDQLAQLNRLQRSLRLVEEKIIPHFDENVSVVVRKMDESLVTLEPSEAAPVPVGSTNYRQPLSTLAATREHDALLMVSDGRQTSGADALPVVQAIHAHGRRLGSLVVGDPEQPRDAVIADLRVPEEVFSGERIPVQVRFRITGFDDQPWNLIIERDGAEVDRRQVWPAAEWQNERFEVDAQAEDSLATHRFVARLEIEDQAVPLDETRGLLREVWTGIKGSDLKSLIRHGNYPDSPTERGVIPEARPPQNWADNYGQRLRGYLIPPISGSYILQISADDQAEVWLGSSADPESMSLVANVADHSEVDEFNAEANQQSTPIALRAGVVYYLELRHKEGTGSDHLSLGWVMPDGTVSSNIPSDYLVPWGTEFADVDPASEVAEATKDNNLAQATVSVTKDPLKVLLLDRQPRWDMRYLTSLFKRDRRIEIDQRYFAVHRARQGDKPFVPATQEELDDFDLIVLGDLSRSELGGIEAEQRLTDFVSLRGGFMIAIAGPRSMPSGYALGGLADILPVQHREHSTAEPARSAAPRWNQSLAPDGEEHPITAVLDDPDLNRQLWPALPAFTWSANYLQAKPASEVLLTVRHADQQDTPLLVIQEVGAGQVCFLGSDETWRWRDRLGDRVHQTFWLQVLRWGLAGRLRGKEPQLQVGLDRSQIDPGTTIRVRARARDAEGAILDVPLRVAIEKLAIDGEVDEIVAERELLSVEDAPGIRALALSDLPIGNYRLRVTGDAPEIEDLSEERSLVVRDRSARETLDLSADIGALSRLSAAGAGMTKGLIEWQSVVDDLASDLSPRQEEQRRVTDVFRAGYFILLLALALMLAEWLLRKRSGLP